ncbi:MAG: hypothetical protein OWR52_07155 [Acidibacillus sp.]|uniref:Uncharacterized protein n=1 Tax=Sulfoacidibacillus ferrooxidans TaxID=2005001 RepID=A0A9X2AE02_9BACL|nr:hypothetical protein [Sulfoacidibacillus ferrooxidans]MCI0182832.1 hypothetical protein [Sulfoacidibacillus ferrooxidans]MCY0893268.1 hypothetical protein [Acidibacillus sp.]
MFQDVENRLKQAQVLVHEALDLSLSLFQSGQVDKASLTKVWSGFVSDLFGYIKVKSKETKHNVLAWIKFPL